MNARRLWDTATNLAYPIFGLWTGDHVFALMMLGLGSASAYYHAGGQHGNHWDVGAIYAVLIFLFLVAIGIPPIYVVPFAIPGGWALRMKQLDVPMEHKIGGLILPIIGFGVSAALITGSKDALMAFGISSGVLGVALAIRAKIDHGLWHVVSALGLALLWYAGTLL